MIDIIFPIYNHDSTECCPVAYLGMNIDCRPASENSFFQDMTPRLWQGFKQSQNTLQERLPTMLNAIGSNDDLVSDIYKPALSHMVSRLKMQNSEEGTTSKSACSVHRRHPQQGRLPAQIADRRHRRGKYPRTTRRTFPHPTRHRPHPCQFY